MAGIIIELSVDDKGSVKIKQFTDQTKQAFEEMKKGPEAAKGPLDSLSGSWVGLTAKLGIATAAVYAIKREFFDTAKEIASATNEIEKQSKLVGMSTDTFQKWMYAAKMSDLQSQEFTFGLRLLSRNLEDASAGTGDAAKYFNAMGISVKDAAGHLRPLNETMQDIMGKFAQWEDGPRKIAVSLALFGRGGEALLPLLSKGRDGFQEFSREAERLGLILSPGLVKKGSEAEGAFKRISAQWEATKLSFAPAAKAIAEALEPVLAIVNLVSAGIGKIKAFSDDIERFKYKAGLGSVQYEKRLDAAEMERETAEYYRNKAPALVNPPAITDFKKYFEDQKTYYDSLSKQAEQMEKAAYGGMENKAFFDQLKEQKELEDQINQALQDRVGFRAYEIPTLEQIVEMEKTSLGIEEDRVAASAKAATEGRSEWVAMYAETPNTIRDILRMDSTWKTLGDDINSVWGENVKGILKGTSTVADAFKNMATGMADTFISAVAKMITNWILFENVQGTYKSGAGVIGLVGGLFAAKEGGIIPGPWMPIHAFDEGGLVTRPTFGVVGEGGGPEAVVPLKGGKIPIEGGGGGGYYEINHIQVLADDPRSFEERHAGSIIKVIKANVRQAGAVRDLIRGNQ